MEYGVKRNLLLFVPAKVIAVLGSSIYSFAIGLYILSQTGSSLNFAITLLLSSLPRVVFSPIAGGLADRWDRKKIIVLSDFACAVWLGAILFLFTFTTKDIWLLYVAAAVLNTLNTFYSNAVTSTIYNMVGPGHLQKALSLNQSASSLSTILGPVLGGALFGFLNIEIFMAINIFAFTISGILNLFIRYNLFAQEKNEKKSSSFFHDLKEGFIYVKNEAFIKQLVIFSIWLNFWFAAFPVAMPYLILVVRKMPSYQLGIIEGTFSVGTLLLALILSVRPETKKKDWAILGGITGISAALILLGVPSLPIAAGIPNGVIFVYFIALILFTSSVIMIVNMPIMILLQKKTPDELRGRVMSLLETGAGGMAPLGFILFGMLFEKLPAWLILGISGAATLALVAYHFWKGTFARHLREDLPDDKQVVAHSIT